jgi:hypothetical protein
MGRMGSYKSRNYQFIFSMLLFEFIEDFLACLVYLLTSQFCSGKAIYRSQPLKGLLIANALL